MRVVYSEEWTYMDQGVSFLFSRKNKRASFLLSDIAWNFKKGVRRHAHPVFSVWWPKRSTDQVFQKLQSKTLTAFAKNSGEVNCYLLFACLLLWAKIDTNCVNHVSSIDKEANYTTIDMWTSETSSPSFSVWSIATSIGDKVKWCYHIWISGVTTKCSRNFNQKLWPPKNNLQVKKVQCHHSYLYKVILRTSINRNDTCMLPFLEMNPV